METVKTIAGEEYKVVLQYNGDYLVECPDNIFAIGRMSGETFRITEATQMKEGYGREEIIPLFFSKIMSEREYDNLGMDFFERMDYEKKFRTVLFNEKPQLSYLPEDLLQEIYDNFLGTPSISGIMNAPDIELVLGGIDYNRFLEDAGDKPRLFIDFDGTIAKWQNIESYEELLQEGFIENSLLHENFIDNVKSVIASGEYEVFVLSLVIYDSPYPLLEKNSVIDRVLPEIDLKHRIFPPFAADTVKADYIPGGIRRTDILIDDYTKNLAEWRDAGGQGLKILTDANNNKGTWLDSGENAFREDCSLGEFKAALDSSLSLAQVDVNRRRR